MSTRNARFVYLHGFASGAGSQKAQFFRDRLREFSIELEIPDLAQGDFENLTLTGQLRVITDLAAGRRVSLIGSSLGGYLAALYAARHSEVRQLVLLAPAFAFTRRWREEMGPAVEEWKRTGFLSVYHYGEKRNRSVKYGLVEDARQYEDYPNVAQPVLIFHGDADDIVPHEHSAEFALRNPHAHVVLMHSDHQLLNVLDTIWDQVRVFLELD